MSQATTSPTIRSTLVALGVCVIAAAETVALLLIVIALFTPQPVVPGVDTGQYETVWVTSILAGLLSTFALAMTGLLVTLDYARARWLCMPALMLLTILARYHAMPGWGW